MSHQISQSRLSYSRQFLLQYENIYKPDQTITDKLSPHLSPPRSLNTSKKIPNPKSFNGDSLSRSARTPNIKKSAYISKTDKKQQNSYKIRDSNCINNNVIAPQNEVFISQKENTEPSENTKFYRPVKSSPNLPDMLNPSHTLSYPTETPISLSDNSTTSPLARSQPSSTGIGHFDMTLPFPSPTCTTPSVFFYESKFSALFKSQDGNAASSEVSKTDFFDLPLHSKPDNISSFGLLGENLTVPFAKFTEPMSKSLEMSNKVQPPSISLSPSSKSMSIYSERAWVPVDQKGTPKTPVYIKTPDVASYKQETSPYRASRTPKSPHGSRPISPLDEQRLIQRQKQIDYGYRTVGYLRYRLLIPKDKRKPEHPRTPKKAQGCSKRSWDGQLKKWRRDLHLWDPDNMEAFRALLNSDLVETIITANPELAEIVNVVRDKLDNPLANDEGIDDSDEEGLSHIGNNSHSLKGVEKKKKSGEPRLEKVARTLVF